MAQLPPRLQAVYTLQRDAIQQRLRDFAAIPSQQWFYELCYCILTPQSKAVHADAVIQQLIQLDFQSSPRNVVEILRDNNHYIRFHNVKHQRLHAVQQDWFALNAIISQDLHSPLHLRKQLVERVNGFGYKEASHFMRNIGVGGLTILDRHILRCLEECGVIAVGRSVGSVKSYLEVEQQMLQYAAELDLHIDELDLLFWASKTGEIRK